jgi:CxxC-x17-CxxC domain-containing protein
MQFVDKVLMCIDCETEFVFTADEQQFFHEKQFVHIPKRCRKCRARHSMGAIKSRPETRTTCSKCGLETTVPFKPTKGLPVLCRSCFHAFPPVGSGAETTGKGELVP